MSTPSNKISYGSGYVVQEESPNHLIGRLLTLVETCGLKETQEKSLKDLIRQEVWSQFTSERGAVYINNSLNDEIQRVIYEIQVERRKEDYHSGLPSGEGMYNYEFTITKKKL